MTDGISDNILEWFKNVYLPLRLMERNIKVSDKDQKDADPKIQKFNIWYKIAVGNSQ